MTVTALACATVIAMTTMPVSTRLTRLRWRQRCDGDCNDYNSNLNLLDIDSDGFTSCDGDCNDFSAATGIIDNDGDGVAICLGDCDDNDPALETLDLDGDGYSTCDNDCDDSDPAMTPADADGDGYSLCDSDCDDNDASRSPQDSDGDGLSLCDYDCNDYNHQSVRQTMMVTDQLRVRVTAMTQIQHSKGWTAMAMATRRVTRTAMIQTIPSILVRRKQSVMVLIRTAIQP